MNKVNLSHTAKKLISLLGISLIGTSAIITIPFISTSCGGPKDEIIAHDDTKQGITTKIMTYLVEAVEKAPNEARKVTDNLDKLANTYSDMQSTGFHCYSSLITRENTSRYNYWHSGTKKLSWGDLLIKDFTFIKRINENSSIYSFRFWIQYLDYDEEQDGSLIFDTYKTDHNIYVDYTGSGML